MLKTKLFLSVFIISLIAAPLVAPPNAQAQTQKEGAEIAETRWEKRCQKDPKTGKENKKQCEIFKKIGVKEGGTRIAEMAIGFPLDDKGKKSSAARGVVILPLGMLLESGVIMQVDENKPAAFKVRFCTQGGCVAYINLNKSLLSTFKNGNQLLFQFKTSQGRDVKVLMSLKGFTKAIRGVD